ncbi:MAG: filamentous hemagglutinin N-terminal domain-containing protein [Nitrospira sp.]|nr:filamentous hemagglutinin N-terminal domain-containing protein [Nitrospira sp.]
MTCRPAGLPLFTYGLLAFLMLLGQTASIAYGQATNIVATPSGPGGLGTSLSTSGNTTNITGGTRPAGGPNLFHSFNQFSVGAGDVAAFVNPGGVSNIISRVMAGGAPSNINGTIQALNANLYFLNPAGIVFGPSARLNVTFSAYFSTAPQLRLNGGGIFSATIPALDATLSVGSPESFGFLGSGPYNPIVLSSGTVLQTNVAVGLIGGTIQINGSKITAQRIIVGSTASAGDISAQPAVADPFSGASGSGQIQATPGTLLAAGGGAVIPASIDVFPSNITVPTGTQVNSTIVPGTTRVTQITVVGVPLSNLPAPSFTSATETTPGFGDPLVFLNRAAMVLPQEAPASPAPLLTSRCAARKDGAFSSLVQASRDVTPSQPGGSLAAPVVLEEVGGEVEPGAPATQTAQSQGQSTVQGLESWQGC